MTNRKVFSVLLLGGIAVLLTFWGDPFALQLVAYVPIIVGSLIAGADVPDLAEVFTSWYLWRSVLVLAAVVVMFQAARRAWPTRRPLESVGSSALHRLLVGSVVAAIVPPLVYATTRLAWAFGWPLGIDPDFFDGIRSILANGLVLGLLAVGGAVLTVGLVRPWGEVFPRWIPGLGGREVPIGFARRFALLVALLIAAAGPYFIREMLAGGGISIAPEGAEDQWGAWFPELLWPIWAIALAIAAFAYEERRLRNRAPAELTQPIPTPR